MNKKYYKNKFEKLTCVFCGKEFDPQGTHLRIHNISNKEYYDKYLKTTEEGICSICGKQTKFLSIKCGYAKFCCNKCAGQDETAKENRKKTNKQIYGYEFLTQSPKLLEKAKNTRSEKNNGNYFSDESIEAIITTKFEKNNGEFESQETKNKRKETNLNKWGKEYYFQTDDFKTKSKEKCLNENGCEYYTQTNECRNGLNDYFTLDKFEEKRKLAKEQSKKTCFLKYKTEYSFQSENNKTKTRKTLIKKYKTIKNSYIERNKKTEETNLEKYGYKHPAQSPDIDCTSHRIQYDGQNFDSKWEFLYYKYLKENNIDFIFHPKLKFEFEYDGEIRIYKPDFIVEGIVTEVKGDHFFKDGKMICPWKYKNDTPDKIEWRNGLFEAKHQCMLNNGVRIIKYNELNELGIL